MHPSASTTDAATIVLDGSGRIAPDLTLASDSGEDILLSQFRGNPVVLYFYPNDDTRVAESKYGTDRRSVRRWATD